MAGEVKFAQVTISEHWHDHVHHKTVGKAPRWDPNEGVICACGVVLGWPDPENRETLSAYTKRVAKEQVDAASAPGRVKGAFGEYPSTPVPTDDPVAIERREVEEAYAVDTAGDPGPEEPPEFDWDEPPEDEPEPVVLTVDRDTPKVRDVQLPDAIEDGDSEDVGYTPMPLERVDSEGKSWSPPPSVDDVFVQPGEVVPGPMEPDQDTTRGPIDFAKLADEAQADLASSGWSDGERTEEAEIADGSQAEYSGEELEVGRDLVPFAGTPLMPTDSNSMDPLNRALPPLDPTLPYTPADVELKILEVLQQGERGERFLREQLARLHQAQHNLDLRYNLAIAKSEARAADQRKAEAWIATEQERFEATEAEMLVRALRDNLHNLRAQLSGFQSVARSLGVSLTNSLDGRDMPRRVESHREPPEPSPWEYR